MIALLAETQKEALEQGYDGLKVTGEMTWVLEGVRGSEKVIEYESKLNDFFPNSKSTAICQYNENLFSKEILVEVIHTHPRLIIYGNLYENNLFYAPTEYKSVRRNLNPDDYDFIRDDILKNHS